MLPYLVRVGGLSIPAYPMLYGLGIAAGFYAALVVCCRLGVLWRRLVHLLPILVASIMTGGAILYAIQFREELDFVNGGQTLYGSLLLSLLAVGVYCNAIRLPLWKVLDALAYGTPLGIALGRVGCFCRGCCEGVATSGACGVCYPIHVNTAGEIVGPPAVLNQICNGAIVAKLGQSLPVLPVQLFESSACLLMFAILLVAFRLGIFMRDGRAALTFLILYCCWRFVIEFYRVEPIVSLGLTLSQLISAGTLLMLGAVFILRVSWQRMARREAK
ncbi:MAG: prolipoprotein diacylglyceryl transferase [Phycisphaerales bacterium]|nr:prolipoprotein diacylglyceryl transferase [Phycisphaerales bacterium]